MGEQKTALFLLLILCFSVAVLEVSITAAEGQTIVVPDDYPTIVDAISNAYNGDTILVREGTHEGPINQTIAVDKTLSIIGESTENTIIKLYPAYNETWILTTPFFDYSDAIAIKSDGCKLLNLTVIIANPGGFISATANQIQITGNNITMSPSTGLNVNGSYCNITDNIVGGHIQLNGSFNEVARNSLSYIYLGGSWNIIKDNVCGSISLGYINNNTDYNIVSGNRVKTTTRNYSGISLAGSNHNRFFNNHVSGFSFGFELFLSSNNTIFENIIADSLSAGISLGGSFNNTIYLNSFVDNMFEWTPHVYDYYTDPNIRQANPNMTLSVNLWDNGKEGNYWQGYNGTDADGDGIGDTPYVINEKNQDNYPLMEPVEIEVIPEFPSWTPMLIMLVSVLVVVTVYKQRLSKKQGRIIS